MWSVKEHTTFNRRDFASAQATNLDISDVSGSQTRHIALKYSIALAGSLVNFGQYFLGQEWPAHRYPPDDTGSRDRQLQVYQQNRRIIPIVNVEPNLAHAILPPRDFDTALSVVLTKQAAV